MADQAARILVVDDERFFREAIREILAGAGFETEEAENGEAGFERAKDPSFAVVLLDIQMPGIDGIEVLRRLRDERPDLRVIVLSAHTDQEHVLDALRLGACDYLAKPLHDEELVLAVKRAAESFAISRRWGRMNGRLDRLAGFMEGLSERADASHSDEREAVVSDGAAEAAADVLGAAKTSLMLLNEEGTELQVRSAWGRRGDVELDPVAVGGLGSIIRQPQPGSPTGNPFARRPQYGTFLCYS